MPIKSFRGKISDYNATVSGSGIDVISLHTNTGSTGYRIVKMQVMHAEPGQQDAEHTVKVYSVPQTTADNAIDFSDNTLLAAAYLTDDKATLGAASTVVVFDNTTFNQDIYITHEDTGGTQPCNYYIELEMIKLDLNENTVATLKDIRNIESGTYV
jgi:hypothetical protein